VLALIMLRTMLLPLLFSEQPDDLLGPWSALLASLGMALNRPRMCYLAGC
jgi:hypothetical protein